MSASIYAIATMDSKGEEIAFIAEQIKRAGGEVTLVNVGTQGEPSVTPNIAHTTIAAAHPDGESAVLGHTDRGVAVTAMGKALEQFLLSEHIAGKVSGVIGIGGSGGTALITPAMRALPVGVPKIMVSTVASGNTEPYVGCTDITMMYSVVDVAGINKVSRRIFANAAFAIAGMTAQENQSAEEPADDKRTLAMTMFGVTTPCVTAVREQLEAKGNDCLVFHATGTGGRAMEKLVESGMIDGVLDITTTEVCDEVVGGVFAAGPKRFEAAFKKHIPVVMSCGALDMVNFGAKDTVPEPFKDRTLYEHNAQVTLMRTTPDENRQFAAWIANKLNQANSPVTVLIPEKGVSLLDVEGQAFYDPEADKALFDALEEQIDSSELRQIQRHDCDINDPEFAAALVAAYEEAEARMLSVAS